MSAYSRDTENKVKLFIRTNRQAGEKCRAAVNVNRWIRLTRQQVCVHRHKANPGF